MDLLGRIDTKIAVSIEEAEAANRSSGMMRALASAWRFLVEPPNYVPEQPQATVTDIGEGRRRHEPEAADEEITGLEVKPVPVDAEGKVVDMAQHRRLKTAEAEVEAAYAGTPETEPASAEEALEQQ